MRAPTELQIRAMTPEARMTLRANALRIGGEAGSATVALIDSLNMPMSSGGMPADDPVYIEMRDIVWSAEAKAEALRAVEAGLPAMAYVDPLLQKRMGTRYRREAQGTMTAGALVGEVMRYLGYEWSGEDNLPPGCIAKTAATWRVRAKRG
jgi:hypothetical protein